MSGPGQPDTVAFSPVSAAKLRSSGIDPARAGELGIRPVADVDDLPDEFTGNPRATVPGMVIDWPTADGDTVPQYRPDDPPELADAETGERRAVKYLFPSGSYVGVSRVGHWPQHPSTILVVEGTLQSRSAVQWAERDVAVLATPGCWGWSHDRLPAAELAVVRGTDVRVILDADAGTNRSVFDAGTRLAETLLVKGATSVRFPRVGLARDQGLDDLLGACADDEDRRATVASVTASDGGRYGDKPADSRPAPRRDDERTGPGTALLAPNDTVLATTWADDARARWRFLLDTGKWLRYRVGRWAGVHDKAPYDDVARFLVDVAGTYQGAARASGNDDLEDTANLLLSHTKTSTVLSRASGHSDLHVERDELDAHPRLWAAGNGVVDLMSGEFRDHDPELLLTAGSDVIYDPAAQCPRFDAFLAEILPDADVREYVLRLFGVAMFGEVRAGAHVFAVFVGEGRNGKGALLRVMQRLFGSAAVTIEPKALQQRMKEEHLEEVAKLAGKRLATAEEPEEGKGWNTGRIKSWTGGDRLTGRFMRQDSFDFIPSHTLVVTANHRPSVSRSDTAFWMRYREIPFTVTVEGREDPTLEPRIVEHELSGVLNRVLAGRADYLAHGLAEPPAVLAAVREAQAEADHLAVFAEAHLVVTHDEDDRLPAADAYERCRKWWAQNVTGERLPSDRGPNNFTRQLQRVLGFTVGGDNPRKIGKGKDSRLTWTGVRWLGEDDGGGSEGLPIPGLPNTAVPPAAPADELTIDAGRNDGLPFSSPSTAESPTGTADPGTAGQNLVSVDSAESAELFISNSTVGETSTQNQGKSDITSRGDAFISGGPVIEDRIRQNGSPAPLPVLPTAPVGTIPVLAGQDGAGAQDLTRPVGSPLRYEGPAASDQLGPPLVFDLETGSADQLHRVSDPRGYVRIAGLRDGSDTVVHTGPDAVTEAVLSSRKVIGHNVVAFDLTALARIDERVDVLALTRAGRVHDLMVTESVLHPVLNDKRPDAIGRALKWFALDAIAERRGFPGKTDDLDRLAKIHGGYDVIPTDDPEYRAYCAGDVDAEYRLAGLQAAEVAALPATRRDYLAREHRVHAIAAEMGRIGFAVDQALLQHRFWATYGRKRDLTRALVARYGIPTVKADGKPAESPAATRDGKAAILRALLGLGVAVDDIPRTPKDKAAFGGDPMRALAARYAEHPNAAEIAALCDVVADVNGVRSVYGTALEHLGPDGRVHPSVATFQASGRWSVRNPGLTVFGKRGGKVVERAVFRATDPEHALFAIDLSQIDSRAIAVHSQDPEYLALFAPGRDAHEIVARMVWGDAAYDAEPRTLRDRVKAITHGLPYGMGMDKLVDHTGVPRTEAQRVVDTMNERFPRLQEWKDEVRETAARTGWLDNGFGRLMRVDQDRAYTQAPALMGQGTARDAMAECLLRLPDEVARMLRAQVHDEAVFEIPRADADDLVRVITEAFNYDLVLPGLERSVRVEAEPGRLAANWAGCYGAQYDRELRTA